MINDWLRLLVVVVLSVVTNWRLTVVEVLLPMVPACCANTGNPWFVSNRIKGSRSDLARPKAVNRAEEESHRVLSG
jgi:hypothetical protein